MNELNETRCQLAHADNRIAQLKAEAAWLRKRVVDLEVGVAAALNWCGLDGDGISQPALDQLRRAVGLPALEETT